MSLPELIAGVEAHEKTLLAVNSDDGAVATLREQFADRNVRVETADFDAGPRNFALLADGGEFLCGVAVADLLAAPEERSTDLSESPYRPILDRLDQTMFTSYDRGRMLAASREIEDRAWRIGRGALHAGFQTVGNLREQAEVYGRLGGLEDLAVHAYVTPGREPPAPEGVTVHVEEAGEIHDSWFVAFDGAGVDENKCALVAEERDDGFYGFWTYGPSTVDYLLGHLRATYVAPGTGDDAQRSAGA